MARTNKRKFLTGGVERFLYGPKATAKFTKFAKRVAQFATPIGVLRAIKPKKRRVVRKLPKFLERFKTK